MSGQADALAFTWACWWFDEVGRRARMLVEYFRPSIRRLVGGGWRAAQAALLKEPAGTVSS